MGSSQSTFEKIQREAYKALLSQEESIKKKVVTAMQRGDLQAVEKNKKRLTDIKTEWALNHRKLFDTLFTKYDVNKDGVLDEKEVDSLVLDCLVEERKFVPKMAAEAMKEQMKMMKKLMVAMGVDKGMFEKQMKGQLAVVMAALDAEFERVIKDHEQVSKDFFTTCDTNKDHKIQRDEFVANYMRAVDEALMVNSMMDANKGTKAVELEAGNCEMQ